MGHLNRRSVLGGGAAAGLAAPALIGAAKAQSKVSWRVQSHWPKASGSFADSLGVLADDLERRTEGRFTLELFGAGEFAKGPEIYNLVRRGVVPMGTISPGYILDESPVAAFAYGIPGTLREPWEMQHHVKNLGVERLLNEDLNSQGVFYRSEKIYPTELVLKAPIESADSFASLKLRSSGTMLQYLEAAGAAPQMVPGSELYQALSSGVVDGAHWGAAIGAKSMSLWEVAKYHVRPALGVTADAFIVNMSALDDLDDELRLIFEAVVEERFFLRTSEYQHKEAIALTSGIKEMGVEVISFPDAVLEKLAVASLQILEDAGSGGPKAEEAAASLKGLMSDLGYI